jgi:hypothetical protein
MEMMRERYPVLVRTEAQSNYSKDTQMQLVTYFKEIHHRGAKFGKFGDIGP